LKGTGLENKGAKEDAFYLSKMQKDALKQGRSSKERAFEKKLGKKDSL